MHDACVHGASWWVGQSGRSALLCQSLFQDGVGSSVRPLRLFLIGLTFLAACRGNSLPVVDNAEDAGARPAAVALEDCIPRTEDWPPGNHDRHLFEDSITNLKGYKNGAGEIVIAAKYAAAYEFGPGAIAAAVDGTTPFIFIDPNGQVIAQAYAVDNGPDYFQEGLARIVANTRIGFMTDRGKLTIPPQFDRAESFCHGKAEVEIAGEKYTIDKQGNRMTSPAPRTPDE